MKSVTFGRLLTVMGLGLFSSMFQVNAKEYYKWVDAHGVTTYSATPPPIQQQQPQLDPTKKNVSSASLSQNVNVPVPVSNTTKNSTANTTQVNPQNVNTPVKPNSAIPVAQTKIAIKNCNGVRCWDTKGQHYSLVAGTTYLSKTGSKCQKVANNLVCGK